jgi:HlyD family secretion protein
MSKLKSNEELAEIVRSGASRPIRKWLLIGIALAGAAVWFWIGRSKGVADIPEYVTDTVKRGRISLLVTAAGNLTPTNQVVIGSELSGTVNEVYVDTNDTVKKNQPLAKLDTTKLNQQTERSRAALLAAKAKVKQTQATLTENEASLARQEELLEISGGKTPSRAAMDTSRAAVARAEADLESARASVTGAEAEVKSFERDLQVATIVSPVDGIVLSRNVEVGQTVAASFTAPNLFTIAEDLRKMELLVSVSEADISRVEAGQTATFSVDAWPGRSYTAKVKKVAFGSANNQASSGGNGAGANTGAASTGVVLYSTELEVANEDLSLRPGMTATVDIAIVDKPDILVVPNAALRFDPALASLVGKPDADERTLVESLTSSGPRRWYGTPAPKAGSRSSEPRVWILRDGEPVEVRVDTGITDGRQTEISNTEITADTPVIVSIKPKKTE